MVVLATSGAEGCELQSQPLFFDNDDCEMVVEQNQWGGQTSRDATNPDNSTIPPLSAARRCLLLRGALSIAALVALVLGCNLAWQSLMDTPQAPLSGDPAASGVSLQALESATAFGDSLIKSLDTASSLIKDANSVAPRMKKLYNNMKNASKSFAGIGKGFSKEVKQRFVSKYKSANETVRKQMRLRLKKKLNMTHLLPRENLTDGNPCGDDEEPHAGLCYKKCVVLTQGKYPIRTSAWTCCEKQPCGLFNFKHSFKMCGGFDIAGDSMDNECPHPPGTCLKDEQYTAGICYKSCELLTLGEYPYRMSGQTCCKVNSVLACLFAENINMSLSYTVGGGGEGTFSAPHVPSERLTEET